MGKNPLASVLLIALTQLSAISGAAQNKTETPFDSEMNRIAQNFLKERAKSIDEVKTQADAQVRKKQFRAFVLHAIGGLPNAREALNSKVVGTLNGDGFKVERVIYDSLPGFHVTANLYLPTGAGTFPAVLFTPGHYPFGKIEAWDFATNMARHGIAVLAYDPIGEGERLQYLDAKTMKSLAGPPTGEHTEASVQIALTGDHIARYFVWDAMRGIDYLQSRPEIDGKRIGAVGCSGGGAVTAFLATLDSRVKAAGSACYITGFHELLNSIGPQEAEQSIPSFIQHEYDFPDWIESAAPTPYAVISTTEDMFPFDGARRSVEEARRIYALYGTGDRLQWITGPGRHGHLQPIHPEIIGFFLHWLKGADEKPALVQLKPPAAKEFECTSTGQVGNSLGGETLVTINRARAQKILTPRRAIRSQAALRAFQAQIRREVRQLTGAVAVPGTRNLNVIVIDTEQHDGYTLRHVSFASASGIELRGVIAVPDGSGKRPAVLLLDEKTPDETNSEFDRLARAGNVVFRPEMVPGAKDTTAPKSPLLGPLYMASLRAQIVGKTLVGLRVDDAIRCVDWLSSQPEVDAQRISGYGVGPMGIALLHAAALDDRLHDITLDSTLLTFRSAIEAPVTKNLAQSVIPGVLRSYDLDDLLVALGTRRATLVHPLDGAGGVMNTHDATDALAWVMETDRSLNHNERVQILKSQ